MVGWTSHTPFETFAQGIKLTLTIGIFIVIFLWFSFCSNTAHSFVAEICSLTTSLCVVIPQACWLLLLYPTLFGSRYSRMDQVEFVKIVFKKFGEIWSAYAHHITSNFLKAILHKFSWSILEFLDPNKVGYNKWSQFAWHITNTQ